MRKTICLVTDWYPTPENKMVGVFFKEQAFAMSDEMDFVIFRYKELLKRSPFSRDYIQKINEENNTIEYAVVAYISLFARIQDLIKSVLVCYSNKKIDGIGRYFSTKHKSLTRKKITKLYEKAEIHADAFYCVDAQCEAFYCSCLAEANDIPYIVAEHAPVPWPGSQIQDVNKYAIEKADRFLAISNDKIRQLMLQNIKLPKTTYIGNLIDESKLSYLPKTEKHTKTFVIVAAHSFYKNYDMFIQVMNRLTEITDENFKVMIVGYGANKGYSSNADLLERKIAESKFKEKAEMIPEVPHEEICDVYNKADAFVMTSIQEGQPVSAMEAACCGLPIFSTRCGGVEDYVDDSVGRIYAITDIEGMANGLKDYLEGKIVFDAAHIRDKVISQFGREAFTNNFKNVMSEAIEEVQDKNEV